MTTDADTEIDWVDGSAPDLTEREQLLVKNAYDLGVEDGIRRGKRIGGNEAVKAMTVFANFLSDRKVAESLATLHWFITDHTEAPASE